jgi:sugar/nucleoside kinase (ribokinase family)
VSEQGWAGSIIDAMSASMPQLNPPLSWNTERISPDHPLQAPSWAIPPDDITVSLGGSAFNAVHVLAATKLGFKLGYIGMMGKNPPAAPSFPGAFDALGIDHSFVRHDLDVATGVCLSLMENGEPTMVTYAGANAGMAQYLESELDAVAAYLAGANMVHVTSLLDPISPLKLIPVVQAAKRINPKLIVSFDPGYEWCRARNPVLGGVGSVSDIVSMSRSEVRAAVLGDTEDDEAAAREIRDRYMGARGYLSSDRQER